MRLIVFFDLPVETSAQRKAYRQFRKHLINEGYLMMQESVYSKLVVNDAMTKSSIARLEKVRPKDGLVQILKVTEKQFTSMIYITGNRPAHEEIDNEKRFIVL